MCTRSDFSLPWRQDGVEYFLRLLVLLLLDIAHVGLAFGRGRHGPPAANHSYPVRLAGFGCASLCVDLEVQIRLASVAINLLFVRGLAD